ncbi:hypothetical protein EJ110_NYTH05077 [Nymphaea thermarum]|nr:hypothetical protein EJ110_NYTH05077 [Nymphaea thermarum]
MLKLEPAHTDNRSLATRTRRFFTVPSGRNGLKIATIFFLCVLIVTFFTFFIGAAKNNYQPYRHHDDRHVYFSRRNVAVKIPSKSTTDGRTPTSRFPPAYLIVALILICIGYFFRRLLDYIRRWRSEPSQHPGPLPSTDAGSSSTATDWVPWPSTANRDRSPLSEDEIQPVSQHHASSRMRVAPRLDEERNIFEARSRAPAGDWDSWAPTSDGCEALSSDESPEHRLVLRRRHYEDRTPYPSPCGSSAMSPDHGCGEPDGGPTTGEHLQGSFPCQDYDPIHDPYFYSGDRTVDMDQTPFLDPMRPCSPSTDPAAQVLTNGEEDSGELLGSLPRQDYDPIHDAYLHSGDPAVEDLDQNANTDPITLCPPSIDPAAQEPASAEESSGSASSNTDWSGRCSTYISHHHPDGLILAKMAAVAVVSLAVATASVITHEEFDALQRRFLLSAAYYASSSLTHLPAILCLLTIFYADRLLWRPTAGLDDPSPSPAPILRDQKGSEAASQAAKCSGREDFVLENDTQTGQEPALASPYRDFLPQKGSNLTEKFSGSGRRDEAARSDDVQKGCLDGCKPQDVLGQGLPAVHGLTESLPVSPPFRRRRYDARFVDIDQVGPTNRSREAAPSSPTGNNEPIAGWCRAFSPAVPEPVDPSAPIDNHDCRPSTVHLPGGGHFRVKQTSLLRHRNPQNARGPCPEFDGKTNEENQGPKTQRPSSPLPSKDITKKPEVASFGKILRTIPSLRTSYLHHRAGRESPVGIHPSSRPPATEMPRYGKGKSFTGPVSAWALSPGRSTPPHTPRMIPPVSLDSSSSGGERQRSRKISSVLSFFRPRKAHSGQEDAMQQLRVLQTRLIQWTFVNAKALAKMAAVAVVSLAVATACVITHEEFDALQRRFLLSAAYYASSSLTHLPAILCLLTIFYADRLLRRPTAGLDDPSPSAAPILRDQKGSEAASQTAKCSRREDFVLENDTQTRQEPALASPSRDFLPQKGSNLMEKFSGSGRRDEAARSDDVQKGCLHGCKPQDVLGARPPRCPVDPSSIPRPAPGIGLDGLTTPTGKWPGTGLTESLPVSPPFRRRRYDARFVDIDQVGPTNRRREAAPSSPAGNNKPIAGWCRAGGTGAGGSIGSHR